MNTAVTLAILGALCVLGQEVATQGPGDLRTIIEKDLQKVIDSLTATESSGRGIVQSAADMKLRRQELCWKLAASKVLATSLPESNDLTNLYNELDTLSGKLESATDEEINGYMFEVLEGDNSYITRILATGDKFMSNANNQIKGLSLDLVC